jgi:hypothetical protein
MPKKLLLARRIPITCGLVTAASFIFANVVPGQTPSEGSGIQTANVGQLHGTGLPDAPGLMETQNDSASNLSDGVQVKDDFSQTTFRFAPKYALAIEPGYQARPLGAGAKIVYSAHEIVSAYYLVGVLVSGGFSQLNKDDPEYGSDRQAFAQRIGAAGAQHASEIVFSSAIVAPIFREDPRYHVMGPGHSLFRRFAYAATRPLVTRTDEGSHTVNFAVLAGYGGSAALTQLYYPARSRNTDTILSEYGLSLSGRAIQCEIAEFFRFVVRGQPR